MTVYLPGRLRDERLLEQTGKFFESRASIQAAAEDFQGAEAALQHRVSQIYLATEAKDFMEVPWWTSECKEAVRARKAALKQLRYRPSEANLIHFKMRARYV